MTIETLQNRKESVLATARELASGDGDLAQVKSLMAEAKSIEERIETIKSLGVTAPVVSPAVEDKPWKSGGVSKRMTDLLPGATADERNYKAYQWGQWARSIMGNRKAADWVKNHIKANEGTDSAGGYTVPDPLSSDLIYLREQFGIARQNCRIYPMSSDTLRVPNGTASTTVYYPGENTAITLSDMTFAQVSLTAKKAAVLTQVSKELAEDSIIDFGASLARDMAYVLAKEEDRVVFSSALTGTDASGLVGLGRTLINLAGGQTGYADFGKIASAVVGAAGTGATWSGFTLANLQSMLGKLPTYAGNPKWFMHKNFFYTGIADKLAALGGNNIDAIQNAYGVQPLLYGIPVVFVQNMIATPAIDSPVAFLADLSVGTAFGDRRSVTIEVSDQQYFKEDALAFKATERFAFSAFDSGNYDATAANRVPGSYIGLLSAHT